MKTTTPHPKNLGRYISRCCNSPSTIIMPFFRQIGYKCNKCHEECEVDWQPAYYEVSRGTWRKIDFPTQTF